MNKHVLSIFFSVFTISVLVLAGLTAVFAQENQTNNETTSELEYNFTISENETNTTEGNQSDIFEEPNFTEESTNTTETSNTTIEETGETNTTEINQTEENATTILVCSALQCDGGCTICSDGSCHAPEEECTTALVVEKVTPSTVKTGEQQLNILIKNTGTVALFDIEAEVSGYGITTLETLSIEALPSGEKDYTFTKVLAENAGVNDIIVKVYANQTLITQEIVSLTVAEEEQEEEEIVLFNQTAALAALNETRVKYNALEMLYYEKEKQEYLVFGIDKDLVEIKEYLRQAQVAVIEQDEDEFQKNLVAAQTTIENVAAELESAQKEDKTFIEILSENLALIGSLFGVLISGVTVWSMTKVHLKRAKIVNIIKGKQIVNVDKNTDMENIVESDESKTKDL